uniref:Uncharacterized protein n=1 Tax=Pararge aegeria TaxID=116150 RepID=S4PD84_9NEOP
MFDLFMSQKISIVYSFSLCVAFTKWVVPTTEVRHYFSPKRIQNFYDCTAACTCQKIILNWAKHKLGTKILL